MDILQDLIGQSAVFIDTIDLTKKFAKCDACVLLQGETGTGKELFARAIHYLGARRAYPFVAVNCGALPETLIESELFGNEKGAFTDAHESRRGLIKEAEGGTLFLDEVDSMPMRAQISLLRFLQDQTYRPLGGRREVKGDVRVIAAASNRMSQRIEEEDFRLDLAFRLGVLEVRLPPLRERPGDPELLAEHFIGKYAERYHTEIKQLDCQSIDWANCYDWPGNVRELENLIHRNLLLTEDHCISITPPDYQPDMISQPRDLSSIQYSDARSKVLNDFEKQYVISALTKTHGNVTHAASLAHMERRAFGKLLKKHNIDRNQFK